MNIFCKVTALLLGIAPMFFLACAPTPATTVVNSCTSSGTVQEIDSGNLTLNVNWTGIGQPIRLNSKTTMERVMLVAQTQGLTSLTFKIFVHAGTSHPDYYREIYTHTFTDGLTNTTVAPAWFTLPTPFELEAAVEYVFSFRPNADMTVGYGNPIRGSRLRSPYRTDNGNGYFGNPTERDRRIGVGIDGQLSCDE